MFFGVVFILYYLHLLKFCLKIRDNGENKKEVVLSTAGFSSLQFTVTSVYYSFT